MRRCNLRHQVSAYKELVLLHSDVLLLGNKHVEFHLQSLKFVQPKGTRVVNQIHGYLRCNRFHYIQLTARDLCQLESDLRPRQLLLICSYMFILIKLIILSMERDTRIELASQAWEARV